MTGLLSLVFVFTEYFLLFYTIDTAPTMLKKLKFLTLIRPTKKVVYGRRHRGRPRKDNIKEWTGQSM